MHLFFIQKSNLNEDLSCTENMNYNFKKTTVITAFAAVATPVQWYFPLLARVRETGCACPLDVTNVAEIGIPYFSISEVGKYSFA